MHISLFFCGHVNNRHSFSESLQTLLIVRSSGDERSTHQDVCKYLQFAPVDDKVIAE